MGFWKKGVMVTVWGEVSISREEASLKEAEHESRSSENTVFVVVGGSFKHINTQRQFQSKYPNKRLLR